MIAPQDISLTADDARRQAEHRPDQPGVCAGLKPTFLPPTDRSTKPSLRLRFATIQDVERVADPVDPMPKSHLVSAHPPQEEVSDSFRCSRRPSLRVLLLLLGRGSAGERCRRCRRRCVRGRADEADFRFSPRQAAIHDGIPKPATVAADDFSTDSDLFSKKPPE